jgi:hypothetical protein
MTSAAQPSPDGLVERDAELGPGGRTAPGREETTPGAHRAGRQRRVTVAAWLGLPGRRPVGRRPGSRRPRSTISPRATRWTSSGRPRVAPRYGGQPAAATPPDSSQNKMAARRRRAPARILGPVLSHPTGDGLLVTLDGAAGGPLQPVVQPVAQQLPDVAAMVGDPGQPLDHGGDAVKGPVVGVEAVRAGALPQRLVDGGELGPTGVRQARWGRRCAVPPARPPATGRASGWRSGGRHPG